MYTVRRQAHVAAWTDKTNPFSKWQPLPLQRASSLRADNSPLRTGPPRHQKSFDISRRDSPISVFHTDREQFDKQDAGANANEENSNKRDAEADAGSSVLHLDVLEAGPSVSPLNVLERHYRWLPNWGRKRRVLTFSEPETDLVVADRAFEEKICDRRAAAVLNFDLDKGKTDIGLFVISFISRRENTLWLVAKWFRFNAGSIN